MRRVALRRSGLVAAAAIALSGAFALAASHRAEANEGRDVAAAFQQRCANRLAIAFTGGAASPEALSSADPKVALDQLLESDDFHERFARFINTELNPAPGMSALEDAPYYIAKHVLTSGGPWSEVFVGKFRLAPIASRVAVYEDPDGLGYFRTIDWYKRYEGNEENGVKLATAYRIMNNVVGLRLTASTTSPTTDQSATGRQASACKSCHFDGWFALDKVAGVLPQKGQAWSAYKGGSKEILGGKQIANDKELVTALVDSENFSVNACRVAFKFLYAREDNRCDGPVLDRCVDTFKAKKTIQSALASIAREPDFCE